MMEQDNKNNHRLTAEQLIMLFGYLSADSRINIWHIGIWMAVAHLCQCNQGVNPVAITRKIIMQLAHIDSIVTYHKCIKQLERYGYIKYVPSYNHYNKTTVELNICMAGIH